MTLNEARQESLTADQSDALLAVVISLHIHYVGHDGAREGAREIHAFSIPNPFSG